MTKRNYIFLIAMLYMCGFGAILLFAGFDAGFDESVSLQGLAIMAAGSVFVAWIGTERLLGFNTPNSPRFLLPSIIHGLVVLTMFVTAFSVR